MQCVQSHKCLLLQACGLEENYFKVHSDLVCPTVHCVQCVQAFLPSFLTTPTIFAVIKRVFAVEQFKIRH